ncbi:MAG: ceramidase domain-containing protein [Hyphomicrobiaceae bacterium]|nr:ceramidase domain-containing protein [Hyphomicrobiaceae bacterium]
MSAKHEGTGPLWLWGMVGTGMIVLGCVFAFTPAFPQDPVYHYFAGDLKTDPFWNVITNGPFFLVGLAGLILCFGKTPPRARASWSVFFAGVTMVAFGSSWYHWNPDNQTLVWDRLPMAIGFMGLFVAMLHDFLDERAEAFLLIPSVILGIISVIYWALYDDLRLYGFVQFYPLLVIFVLLFFYKHRYGQKKWIAAALGFYVLAKLLELGDAALYYDWTGEWVPGHPLKHLAAAGGVYVLYDMLKSRKRI